MILIVVFTLVIFLNFSNKNFKGFLETLRIKTIDEKVISQHETLFNSFYSHGTFDFIFSYIMSIFINIINVL